MSHLFAFEFVNVVCMKMERNCNKLNFNPSIYLEKFCLHYLKLSLKTTHLQFVLKSRIYLAFGLIEIVISQTSLNCTVLVQHNDPELHLFSRTYPVWQTAKLREEDTCKTLLMIVASERYILKRQTSITTSLS